MLSTAPRSMFRAATKALLATVILVLCVTNATPASAGSADPFQGVPDRLRTVEAIPFEIAHDEMYRLYLATFGREPESAGHAYWTQQRMAGASLPAVATEFLVSPEADWRLGPDPLADIYANAFDRAPDSDGHRYWSSFPINEVLAGFTNSPELITTTGTVPSRIGAVTLPDRWVDAGNGVMVPDVMLAIRSCESHDDYRAANPRSSARGAYQFLTGTWQAYGFDDRFSAPTADQASPAQQDAAAVLVWEAQGTAPWTASGRCW